MPVPPPFPPHSFSITRNARKPPRCRILPLSFGVSSLLNHIAVLLRILDTHLTVAQLVERLTVDALCREFDSSRYQTVAGSIPAGETFSTFPSSLFSFPPFFLPLTLLGFCLWFL